MSPTHGGKQQSGTRGRPPFSASTLSAAYWEIDHPWPRQLGGDGGGGMLKDPKHPLTPGILPPAAANHANAG